MDQFIAEHGSALVYLLGGLCLTLISVIAWYLKNDRSGFMNKLTELDSKIGKCKKEIEDKIDEIEGEVDDIKSNYNIKFEKVYDKVDDIRETISTNHDELIKAIHKVELKIPNR